MNVLLQGQRGWAALVRALERLQPLAQLAARAYLAQVFLSSGWLKLRDWDSTLSLFADYYQVPLLPPTLAAWAGTAGEVVLPVLLLLGLGGRFAALGLSVVNAVAALSLPEIGDGALTQHLFWGSLLAGLALWGPGPWALERRWPRW